MFTFGEATKRRRTDTRLRPPRLGHVKALDGIRGIAIGAVLLNHYAHVDGGEYGVDLFFVLSGFLITTLLLEEHEQHGTVRLSNFYMRRARRLLPAAGTLVFLLALLPLAAGSWRGVKVAAAGGLYAANIFRAFIHPDILAGTPLDHFWSLAMEEQFYLVWPIVLLVLLRRRTSDRALLACLAGSLLALWMWRAGLDVSGASHARVYFGPDTHASGLILGCLAGVWRRCGGRVFAAWLPLAAFISMVALNNGRNLNWELTAVEFLSAWLVLGASQPGAYARLLEFKPLVWLGIISYSVYVWHQPVLAGFGWSHRAIAFPTSILVAWLSYRYVEKPFRYGRSTRVEPLEKPPLTSYGSATSH